MSKGLGPVAVVRSVIFNILFYGAHVLLLPFLLLCLPFNRRLTVTGLFCFFRMFEFFEKYILGLTYEVRGREYLDAALADKNFNGCFIFAAKHQSTWETYMLHRWMGDPAVIMKQELVDLPVWGHLARKVGVIGVDRGGRAAAIKSLIVGGQKAKADGRPIVIFPEGTRTDPHEKTPYKFGVGALYAAVDLPMLPVALNSGLFWPRRAFVLRPGKIIVDILPPIPAASVTGYKTADVIRVLQDVLDPATDKIVAESEATFH